MLVPPEILGGHLGAGRAHITGRVSSLAFRLVTAFFGSAGIEWALTTADASERAMVAAWVAEHKARRSLLHGGVAVRGEILDGEPVVHGVVAADGSEALYAVVQLAQGGRALPGPVRLVGLDPTRTYRVRVLPVGEVPGVVPREDVLPGAMQDAPPPWLAPERLDAGVELPGRVLTEVGLPMVLMRPEQALLLEVTAVATPPDPARSGADPHL
ncbi:alpha-galactosidase [Flavimobilis rhizosphaerae]|nr:alpha-galactosidase [Flavimobilis rhizosphaerae]